MHMDGRTDRQADGKKTTDDDRVNELGLTVRHGQTARKIPRQLSRQKP